MKKILLLFVLLSIIGCTAAQQQEQTIESGGQVNEQPPLQPPLQPAEAPIPPPASPLGVPPDIRELLGKANTRTKSLSYNYKGPEHDELYKFSVKGDKIKYLPPRALSSLDIAEAYDTVFIDKTANSAANYCDSAQCKVRGKKMDLDYEEAYIETPFDWIIGISSAEKIGEENIESRSTWKIETNKGTMWIDNYYGIPMKVEADGVQYKFTQVVFNVVEDKDVLPSS